MVTSADLLLRLRADASQAVGELRRTEQSIAGLGHVASTTAKVAVAALGIIGAAGVREFAQFERGMREVFTLLPGLSQRAMSEMSDDVRALADELGILPEKIVPALYEAISAGVPASNVFDFLRTAGKAAIGGVTDLETAVDGLTSVVNAYGADVLSVAKASDIMFVGVKLGKTTMRELADFLFQIVPVAAAAGISFEEVTAALAALTAQGVPTRVAATQIRTAIVELGKSGTIAFDAFKDATGKTFPEFIRGGGTIVDAFSILADEAKRTGDVVQNLFGSVEGGMAATALSSRSGAATVRSFLEQMGDAAGATDLAFETMDEGIGRSWDRIRTKISLALLDIGEAIAPVVETFLDAFSRQIPGAAEALVGIFTGVVDQIGQIGAGFGIVKDALEGLPGPVRASAVGVAALGAGLLLASSHPVVAGLGAVAALLSIIGRSTAEAKSEASTLYAELEALGDVSSRTLVSVLGEDDVAIFEKAGGSIAKLTTAWNTGRNALVSYGNGVLASTTATSLSTGEYQELIRVLNEAYDRLLAVDALNARYAEGADVARASTAEQAFELRHLGEIVSGIPGPAGEAQTSIDALGAEIEAAMSGVEEDTRQALGVFDEWPEQVDKTLAEVKGIFEKNLAATQSWGANLNLLKLLGLDSLALEFETLGPAYASVLDEMLADTENLGLLSSWEAELDDVGAALRIATAEFQQWANDHPIALGLALAPSDLPGSYSPAGRGREYAYAAGGTIPVGGSGIVGDRGIERVRAMSGGGIQVTPIAGGGSSGSTIVELHLHGGSIYTENEITEVVRRGLLDYGDRGS